MTQPDYQSLIDAPTWAFIKRTEAAYPEGTATRSIAEQRAIYDRMCRAFDTPYPAGVTSHDAPLAGVPCRIYPGTQPTVLYLHGGGFVVGGLHSHDGICADIRGATGLTVVSVDYRLSPEHLHPAAFDDACAVARHLAARGPLILVGDSAGANLAAAACHALRGTPQIMGQILIYPGLGGDPSAGSYLAHAKAPMLTRDEVLFYRDIRHGGPAPDADPTVSPLRDTDFTGLPPTLAIAAECDPLADDAPAYARKIAEAGGRARSITEPGLVHGYLRARHSAPRAAASFARITATLTAFAASRWPW
ncbi:alpha/beta hydrolase [Rhodobacter calidifons]|uniref:Alpha/beta hydrolase n=1 Tax=Rhodobacter calidifons TaxID=2715277 RepID=A0ABX0G2D0_9RHOB|nr:alpha/beta hydrolase [Rhodobacter calidifons]NHB75371.1 alpha/beta hydrolase [Rhodobacter calidifons]